MKIILMCIFSIVISVDLFARMNPFEATDTFTDKKEQLIKEQQAEKKRLEIAAIEFENEKSIKKQMTEALIQTKKEPKVKIVEELPVVVEVKKEIIKVIPVKKEIIEDEEFKILPFISIYTVQNTLMIEVDKKYKLFHQESLPKQKKFLFDFQGKESFYTIRKPIKNKNYKSLTVGTHLKEKYFRVVVDLEDNTTMYRKSIDTKNGIVAIQKIRKRK